MNATWRQAVALSYRRFPFNINVVGEVGLEPTKASASGFTVRPLCRSGHSPILGNQSLSKSWRTSQTGIATGLPPEEGLFCAYSVLVRDSIASMACAARSSVLPYKWPYTPNVIVGLA